MYVCMNQTQLLTPSSIDLTDEVIGRSQEVINKTHHHNREYQPINLIKKIYKKTYIHTYTQLDQNKAENLYMRSFTNNLFQDVTQALRHDFIFVTLSFTWASYVIYAFQRHKHFSFILPLLSFTFSLSLPSSQTIFFSLLFSFFTMVFQSPSSPSSLTIPSSYKSYWK